MQNPQMVQMANMNAGAGPMDGTPVMGNGQRLPAFQDPRDQLNTYIYDYFLRTDNVKLAQAMLDADRLNMNLKPPHKSSPNSRNGIDSLNAEKMPQPNMPGGQVTDTSFLLDWWVQFWDIFSAARGRTTKGSQYIQHARNISQAHTENRNQRMLMQGGMNGAGYQNMLRAMPNGVPPTNELKRAAAMNNRPNGNPMANMNQMKNQAMMSQQMQRDGSQIDVNGQRPQSPGSNENGGSPNKRPRVEGAMNAGNMPGNQFAEFAQQGPNAQQKQIEGMNNVAQGSPMNPGLTGEGEIFVGNQPRPGLPAGSAPPQGNHALQDYQMQLMLLEQQNKRRLLLARQEQDNMSGPHSQGPVGGPGFPPPMSPQGSRAGPSPNPTDMKKSATPRMGQQGLPGSPMPEGAMQPQRNSPAPGVAFDHNTMPPGMPPQFNYPANAINAQTMRPPSSHPGFINGQAMTPEQMQAAAMQRNQMAMMQNNGVWRGSQGQPAMMPGQQQMGPMGANHQQNRQMPPPPAPAGEPPRAQEPSPSQPPAPPTPVQGTKANPKKKATKDNKKPANKKGATGATPAASAEEPATPTAPITPVHPKSSFGPNGQQPPQPAQPQQNAPQQPPPMDSNANGPAFGQLDEDEFNIGLGFEDSTTLDNFDFESFMHVGDDSTGFGSLGAGFDFGDGLGTSAD